MTKKIATALMTLAAVFVGVITVAAPAQAAVTEQSRVVAIDLPKAVEKNATALVYLTFANGSVAAVNAPTDHGVTSVLVERPADLASVTVRAGKKRIKPDHFMVTNLAPVTAAYGMTMGCPIPNVNGENVMVMVDGSLVTLSTGATIPTAPAPN